MNTIQGDIEFILWSGDSISDSVKQEEKFDAMNNLTELLKRTFNSQFVFPVLGHTDPPDIVKLGQLWKNWLPTEALLSFTKGGYYMIEMKSKKLKVIALNTNLWTSDNEVDKDPGGQWAWLEQLLAKSLRKDETVYLVGHVSPGYDERQGAPPRMGLAKIHNERYHEMVQKYSEVITGQFFGHLHSDTFRLVYNEHGEPISSIFLTPSITPKRTTSGANNPAIRLYTFDTDDGEIVNYMQYYMDLPKSNEANEAIWTLEYNFTRYYGLNAVSPDELHQLVQTFTSPEGMQLFGRYWMANSVRSYKLPTNTAWTNAHFCAITQLEYNQYQNCLSTRASALAASKMEPTESTSGVGRTFATCLLAIGYMLSVLR
ncbi:acid sphingomyelinase-like phosphodiesterase 3b isoform X2 [Cimex lectularius]|nr:acid sphingomyelinase-like phosphodiesterase 3b isoform X2 [Cimex lectularius]